MFRKYLSLTLGFVLAASLPARAEEVAAPKGGWRATNECFLEAFILMDDGKAVLVYASGEQDDNAKWAWANGALTLTSGTFDKDKFAGHMSGNTIDAEYAWHDKDTDSMHPQMCSFESFVPLVL